VLETVQSLRPFVNNYNTVAVHCSSSLLSTQPSRQTVQKA